MVSTIWKVKSLSLLGMFVIASRGSGVVVSTGRFVVVGKLGTNPTPKLDAVELVPDVVTLCVVLFMSVLDSIVECTDVVITDFEGAVETLSPGVW